MFVCIKKKQNIPNAWELYHLANVTVAPTAQEWTSMYEEQVYQWMWFFIFTYKTLSFLKHQLRSVLVALLPPNASKVKPPAGSASRELTAKAHTHTAGIRKHWVGPVRYSYSRSRRKSLHHKFTSCFSVLCLFCLELLNQQSMGCVLPKVEELWQTVLLKLISRRIIVYRTLRSKGQIVVN